MRRFLAAAVLLGLSIASCTAILGGVPTSGGSGGAGGAGASSAASSDSTSHGGATTQGTGGTIGVGGAGGSGGTTDTSSSGGAGGAGGGPSCAPMGSQCLPGGQCCPGLVCSTNNTCANLASCTSCNDVLRGQPANNFCQGSDQLWGMFSMCACHSGCVSCASPCADGSPLPQDCVTCAEMACQHEYDDCMQDG